MNTKHLQLLRRASPLVLSLVLAAALLVVVRSALAVPRLGRLARITSASDPNRDSAYPSLSEDGTVVAFQSDSDLLNEGIANEQYEIWLYDTATLTYTRVTSASDANRDSWAPSLSGNGTFVAFQSDSDLLNEGRPEYVYEIWLYDTATLTYTRVTSASDASRDGFNPSLSGDRTVVAFRSDSDLLNEGISDNVYEIWLYDTATLTYTRVTSASHANRDSSVSSVNGDGTVVAFRSDSDFLNEGIADEQWEIWLYDTSTLTYTRVTSASHANRDSYGPSLSGDGTVVAFESDSDLLNEGIADEQYEIWLYDTATLTFTRVTSASDANRASWAPSLSGDGTVVAFNSDSDLLNEGRLEYVTEIWLYDTATLTFTRVTSASDANRNSRYPSLSGDGMVVAFESDSDFFNEGIADAQWEIWLWKGFDEYIYLPLALREYP